MAPRAEDAVPVWGIEAGNGSILAARILRRPDGGFTLLDYLEGEAEGPGAQALVAFLRKKSLTGHPMVVAIRNPASHLVSAASTPEDETLSQDELRSELLEHVHPEPENIEFRFRTEPSGGYVMSAEDRSRVESYIAALEAADIAAYSLVSSLDAVLTLVGVRGHLEGDALVVRLQRNWTDLLFLESGTILHQGIPLGASDMDEEVSRASFRADLARLLEYRRLQVSPGDKERVVLLGLDEEKAASVAELLPEEPAAFPADANSIRGKGKMSPAATARAIRLAPAAVGAAIAGASSPRRLELAFRPLPETLPSPAAGGRLWYVAAALLWIALGVAWFGTSSALTRVRSERPGTAKPSPAALDTGRLDEVSALSDQAERRLGLPGGVRELLDKAGAARDGPVGVQDLELRYTGEGNYRGSLRFREEDE